jgi:hypothetical protein
VHWVQAHELNAAAAADALQRTVARSHRIVNRMASQSRLDPLAEGAEKARAKQKKVRALQVPTIEVDAAAIQEARLRIARRHELVCICITICFHINVCFSYVFPSNRLRPPSWNAMDMLVWLRPNSNWPRSSAFVRNYRFRYSSSVEHPNLYSDR